MPREDEKQQFYTKLQQAGMDCGILGITLGFCERFISSVSGVRAALFNFYHEKYEQFLYHEFIDGCFKEYMQVNIKVGLSPSKIFFIICFDDSASKKINFFLI